jgi:hypothetical protein
MSQISDECPNLILNVCIDLNVSIEQKGDMTMSSNTLKKTILVVIAAVLVMSVGMVFIHQRHTVALIPVAPIPKDRRVDLEKGAPVLFDRLEREVRRLERESMAESITRLSDVNMFYRPGPRAGQNGSVVVKFIPLGEDVGQVDLEAIMSNRRFRKIIEEISDVDKSTASRVVLQELSVAINEYLKLYDTDLLRISSQYKINSTSGKKMLTGPVFAIDNVPEGDIVIAGARLKVLALIWTCGMLGFTDNKEQVERVAHLALKQRTDLYDDPTLHPFFKAQMLGRASLYNRQIIASALLGTFVKGNLQAALMKDIGIEWREIRLTSYKSQATEFDLPVRSGVMKVDYSRGGPTVKMISPLDDARFDILLKKLHLIP